METTLYLVRHGEAVDADETDPGLTELGQAQARLVGLRLRGVQFDAVLHGSRRRARETAEIVAATLTNAVPVHSPDADDRTPIPEDQSMLSPALREFLAAVPTEERDPDGRSLDRSIETLRRSDSGDRQLLVVTHNFVIGWFVRDALRAPAIEWTRLNSANCGLTVVRYRFDEPGRLIAFNDTGHLSGSTLT